MIKNDRKLTNKIILLLLIIISSVNTLIQFVDVQTSNSVNNNLLVFSNSPLPEEVRRLPKYESPKISIIIPVFNEERYIHKLIRSIQYQTLKELEIIFVDDCSTDDSYKRMKELQEEDKRITIIQNKFNRGILYNRVYGALQGKGEYITFMDADDMYVNVNILNEAYNFATRGEHIDLLQFDMFGGNYNDQMGFITQTLFTTAHKDKMNIIIRPPELLENYFHNYDQDNLISGIVYDKLYSRSLIKKMADTMGEQIWQTKQFYMEDFIIGYAAALNSKTYIYLGFAGVWHWFNNEEGATSNTFAVEGNRLKNIDKQNQKMGNYLDIFERCFDMSEDNPNAEIFRFRMWEIIAKKQNMDGFSQSYHFERLLNLLRRFYHWKYSTKETKKKISKYAKEIIEYYINLKRKYPEFYKNN